MRITLVLYVHTFGRQGRAMRPMTLVTSKSLAFPTPKFGDWPLIFECHFVGTPNPYNT